VHGSTSDGHDFAPAAVAGGATALLVDHRLPVDAAQVLVDDTRPAMGHLAAAFHGHPSQALTMVGITGTNGKTTTTNLVAAVLDHAGIPAGTIGTLTGLHTTPESPELQARLAAFVRDGRSAVVMEVSSHALTFRRVAGCRFDVAVFTNLGRDHLDLHGTMEEYYQAKRRLFTGAQPPPAAVNVGDEHGRRLALELVESRRAPLITFGLTDAAEIRPEGLEMDASGPSGPP